MGIDAVERVGQGIERAWQAAGYAPDRFSPIATSALADAHLDRAVASDDLIRWALAATSLPPQADIEAKFGQPPLTLFQTPRFHIDALFWVDGTTASHQHAFSGAFQVLQGSSIETTFSFEIEREVDGYFALGRIRPDRSQFLTAGEVRPILSGQRLIHSLFHLDRPSTSLVVRTYRDPTVTPQLNYLRPTVAYDPFYRNGARERSLQIVELLARVEHPALEPWVGDLLARSDLHSSFRVLLACRNLINRALFDRLLARVPDVAARAAFEEAFRESARLDFLVGKRSLVRDAELRFVLAVLINAQRRADALALAASYGQATDPALWLASRLRRLSTATLNLQVGSQPWQPNLLGLPEIDERGEAAVTRELAGRAGEGSPDDRALIERLRALPVLACLFA